MKNKYKKKYIFLQTKLNYKNKKKIIHSFEKKKLGFSSLEKKAIKKILN